MPTKDGFLPLPGSEPWGRPVPRSGAGSLSPRPGQGLHPGAGPGSPSDLAAQGRRVCSCLRATVTNTPVRRLQPHAFLFSQSRKLAGRGAVLAGRGPRGPLPVSSRGRPLARVCVLIASSYKDTNHIGLESTLGTWFSLNHLFKDLSPNTVTSGGPGS